MRTSGTVVLALAIFAVPFLTAPAARSGTGVAAKLDTSVVFDGQKAYERFKEYEAFLESDPVRYDRELATLRRLEQSDVIYVVRIGTFDDRRVEGSLTSDGERIFINVANSGGVNGEVASLNSRFAHEFEHARQFNDGEVAFQRDPHTGAWGPSYTSYDIGDEVRAWMAQLDVALERDHWTVSSRGRNPTLLHLMANADSDEERALLLVQHGYVNRRQLFDANVVFPAEFGYAVGQMLRPAETRNFFGRVNAIRDNRHS
jgi:hypothetical protein